jgi:lysylphosphatidylglycerol synthetase-like protein (DUF2156 family)
VHVAEEAVLPLGSVTFTGKKWQNVRTALNHAGRAGIAAEWCRFSDLPTTITDQIRAVSKEWVENKGVPEMGFTLGTVAELDDDEVRLLLAIDRDRTVHAVTSWLPVRSHGQLIGYTLDFMRRRPGSFNGLMEFLIASAVRDCQAEGMEFVSLSGAPLARIDAGQPPTPLQRALDLLARSLLAFKSRFRPTYQPRYLAYPDRMSLPNIGFSMVRAYLPDLTFAQTLRLVRHLLKGYVAKRGVHSRTARNKE